MSEAGNTYGCRSCGKRYPWSAHRAGQKLLCSCGRPMTVPAEPSADPPTAASASADGIPAAVQNLTSAADAPPRILRYQRQSADPAPNWRDAIRGSEFRHLILPIAFIALAISVRTGMVLFSNTSGASHTLVSLALVAATMALNVVVMLIGVGVVAHFTGADLGPLPIVILKLAACALLGSVAMGIGVQLEMKGVSGGIVAIHALVLLYWMLFCIFFDLDLQETLFAVALVGLMQAGTMCILWYR